ncbi:MAG: ferredoxin family protein [Planctomycetaceae bacterium]|nr:ferredoxin family protein [Planctomycetaceae bacterium]
MAASKITVVVSQAPGKNPNKRQLEEEIATQLILSGTAEVSLIPHLYDLPEDHHGMLWLRSISGDIVVCSWLYPRATRWVLDRNDIRGHEGVSLLKSDEDDDDSEEAVGESPQGIGSVNVPNRKIYVLDLRQHAEAAVYIREIERIANEATVPLVSLGSLGLTNGFAAPKPVPALAITSPFVAANGTTVPVIAETEARRRWYPVIDYSRCTNCMECLDFCLFGVYGVDGMDRILVEEQDNCKRGCPACSRVCPANAIIFPEHKTPAIAGAATSAVGDFKIDLSKLFGAPSALEIAAQERDVELVADGREAVGMQVGIPKRQTEKPAQPRDALDDLMDGLDSLDF